MRPWLRLGAGLLAVVAAATALAGLPQAAAVARPPGAGGLAVRPAARAPATPAVAPAPVQVVDDAGRRLVLARPAERIVSMAPSLTELLFSAGAGARVVGTVAYSDYPPAARQIPRVGDAVQVDLERIVSLRPDLIVVWQQGNSASQIARLRALGIPVYASEPADFDGIASTLRRFGRLAGTAAQADARAAAFEAAVAALRQRYAGLPPLRVFFQIWPRPLMTVNGHHLISRALALCGARNVFAGLAPLAPTVSEEAVVAADPDAILAGSAQALAPWRRLTALRATREGHLLVVDADTLARGSDRIVQGTAALCAQLAALRTAPGR